MTRLGRKIRTLRRRKRLTQQQLGKRVGVDGSAVAHWEAGTNAPRAGVLPKVALALDTTVGELYGEGS